MGETGPSHLSNDPPIEHVLADYSRRVAAGEAITRDDLVSRHPSLADALRSHFAGNDSNHATHGLAESDTETVEPKTDPGTQYRPQSSRTTIPPAPFTPVRSCTLPEQFGRYRVIRCLGQGTMGAVYLADDTQLERPVALKIPKYADDGDEEMTARFYREARAAATLRHANVCPVYDVGEIDGMRYLSMAYIEGRPLSEMLAEKGPLPSSDAATFVLKLARALEAAHARGVIHRDLKPANIMIDGHDEPIIMDFGLARRLNKEDSRLTQEGMLMGSPAYMSPEQVEGDAERMGAGCDIYSLGIILYELLTGEVPFKGSIAAVMGQIISTPPRRPSKVKAGIDSRVEAICLKMIAKRPEDRFASMTEVVRALDAYIGGRPTGVTLQLDRSTVEMPMLESAPAAPPRGIVIAPWMLAVGLALVIGGFGVTWQLIAMIVRQPAGPEEVKVSAQTGQAIARGEAKIVINDKEVARDELKQPIPLQEGSNKIAVREGADVTDIAKVNVPTGDDQRHFLVYDDKNDKFFRKRLDRVVADWVVTAGGRVLLKDPATPIDKLEQLPAEGKIELLEIELPKDTPIPAETFKLILEVHSLKRLVVAKSGLSDRERSELKAALPDLKIETPQ